MFATMVLYALSAAVMSVFFFSFLSILVVWERETDDRVQCCSTLLCSHVSPAHNGALCINKKPMCLQKTETWEPSVKVQSWSAPDVTYLLVMTQERDVSFDSAVTSPCAIFLSFERMVCSSCSGCLNNSMLRLDRCVRGQALLWAHLSSLAASTVTTSGTAPVFNKMREQKKKKEMSFLFEISYKDGNTRHQTPAGMQYA